MQKIELTEPPRWVKGMLNRLAPCQSAIVGHPIFGEVAAGTLPIQKCREALLHFYLTVHNFPHFMGAALSKVEQGSAHQDLVREWLIANILTEKWHAKHWIEWGIGFGISPDDFRNRIRPNPLIDALNHYLWDICAHKPLALTLAAVNYAIEGPTGFWTRSIGDGLRSYATQGAKISDATLKWVELHATYDDSHAPEVLQLVWGLTRGRWEREDVEEAIRLAMEYYRIGLDACYSTLKVN